MAAAEKCKFLFLIGYKYVIHSQTVNSYDIATSLK